MSTMEQSRKIIIDFINSPEMAMSFGQKTQYFIDTFKLVESDINSMQNDKPIDDKCVTDLYGRLYRCVAYIKDSILQRPITHQFKNFSETFLLFVINWNNNIRGIDKKDTRLDSDVQLINRFLNYHFKTVELFDVLQYTINRTKNMLNTHSPQNDLSKHYLGSLLNKVEKENKKDDSINKKDIIDDKKNKFNFINSID